MEAVKKGGDRQELHEEIRKLSMQAGREVKEKGNRNDLFERIMKSDKFNLSNEEISEILNPSNYIGRSSEQVEEFISEYIRPILEENKDLLGIDVELKV